MTKSIPTHTRKLKDLLLDRVSDDLGHAFRIFYLKDPGYHTANLFNLAADAPPPEIDLSEYIEIGRVIAGSKGKAWEKMQGEVWSPNGEAVPVIRALELVHTSMSIGDMIMDRHGEIWIVAMMGFIKASLKVKETDPIIDKHYDGSEDKKILEYQRGMEHLKRLEDGYGHLEAAKPLLETFGEYLHGTAEVEEMGVSIDSYRAVIEDLLLSIASK